MINVISMLTKCISFQLNLFHHKNLNLSGFQRKYVYGKTEKSQKDIISQDRISYLFLGIHIHFHIFIDF